ncbi:MAG: hypothetical protein D6732_16945 [Methanobacteriota archaeon]|nr:MAG: hypothetical protein D6732_16945 [Euryarchaeota archaeon]
MLRTTVIIILLVSAFAPISTYHTDAEVLYEFLIEYRFYPAHSHDNGNTGDFKIEFWLNIDGGENKVANSQFDNSRVGIPIPIDGYLTADSAYLDTNDLYCFKVSEVDFLNANDKVIPSNAETAPKNCFPPYEQFSQHNIGSIIYLTYYEDVVHSDGCFLTIRVKITDILTIGGDPVPIE